MPLSTGSRLGPYEILAKLGEGGMGEVYRARDTKLNRDVALKVLTESFIHDSDRVARLRREAQLLASVNHAHIAGIHGIEDGDGTTALVLELIEGLTLADRLADGPLPLDEALSIAGQIADALEAAHGHGIVHRDLKPANIKIKPDGTVKVLDFGLAKSVDPSTSSPGSALSQAPTAAAVTQTGVILGTAMYMSPEQARGQFVDKRTDIWAFGCVLFEMLTGRRAFHGEHVSDIVANVLRGTPDWNAMPADSAGVVAILQRCLEKDVKRRFRDIADVKALLDDAMVAPARRPTTHAAPKRTWVVAAAAALGLIAGGAAVGLVKYPRTATSLASVERFALASPAAVPFNADSYGANVVIAPDESRLVYTSTRGGVPELIVRGLDQLEGKPLSGSENGLDPFFSPDGQQIGFATFTELKRVAATGGPVTTICPVDAYYSGASWASDNSIVFAQGSLGLFRVPAGGGEREKLAVPDKAKGEDAYVRPFVLPDGKAVLFTVIFKDGSKRLVARRLDTNDQNTIVDGGFGGRYLPSGHLVYADGTRLMGVRFDVATLRVAGSPVAFQDGVFTKADNGISSISSSDNGTVVFVSGHASNTSRLVWLDRHGTRVGVISEPVEYPRNLRLSPDGRRVAVSIGPGGQGQIWIYDIAGAMQPLKLTFENHHLFPTWSPDGKRVAFMERAGANTRILTLPADGSVLQPEAFTPAGSTNPPVVWSPDSAYVLLHQQQPSKIKVFRVSDGQITTWLPTPFTENGGSFSPDGHFVAYSSNQSGAMEVWVRPFPGPGAPVRVSSEGGGKPIWSRDGREILYENGPKLMSARVLSTTPDFRVERPQLLFEGGFLRDDTDPNMMFLDIAPDGRILAAEPIEDATAAMVVVHHLEEELARLLPKK